MAHPLVPDLLGSWALEGCDAAETEAVEVHIRQCPDCAAQARRLRAAASWVGVEQVVPPPAELRQATLVRARAVRPPAVLRTLAGAYASQVDRLERMLDTLATADWQRADPRHGSLAGIVVHLTGNDLALAADLGLPAAGTTVAGTARATWRDQAGILLDGLRDQTDPERPARMAGPGDPLRRPLREALVQRAFETWVHLEDVARLLGTTQPAAPPPEQIRRIIDLATGLLPAALRADGLIRPGRSGRLVLAGPGGGDWIVPLGPAGDSTVESADVEFTVAADSLDFTRLVANRHPVERSPHESHGDRALAAHVLRVATRLGCD